MPETSTMTRAWRTDPVEGGPEEGPEVRARPDRAGRPRKRPISPTGLRRLGVAVARAGRAARERSFRRSPARFEEALHAFAAELAVTTDPEAIEAALLRFARWIAPAGRVEMGRATAGNPSDRNGAGVEVFPVRCGEAGHGVLRLDLGGATAGRGMRRRLAMGCTLAGSALGSARPRGAPAVVEIDEEWGDRPTHQRPDVVRDATFLNAVLPFALGQSRRHGEPLALVCVKLDRLAAIRDLLGASMADRLVHDLGEIVGSIVRTSDIVARLEDDRIVALLVRSRAEGALKVARKIDRALTETGLGSPRLPGVSASIGVAEFPEVADDAASLLDAADEAMAAARGQGGDRIVVARPRPDDDGARLHGQHVPAAREPEAAVCGI